MALTVREARPEDQAAVIACMRTVFEETQGRKLQQFDEKLWRWQYLDAPRGALVVVAESEGELCGYYHCLLLELEFLGEQVLGAMVQDVGTLAAFRRRGIFKAMGARALELLRERDVRFAYTFPNSRSMPSFLRNHQYQEVERVRLYVRPMSSRHWVERRVPGGRLAAGLFGVIDGVINRRIAARASGVVAQRIERFDASVDALCLATRPRAGVRLSRTSAFLNWRFFDKPGGHYDAWGLWKGDALQAYAVFARDHLLSTDCAVLVDGMGHPSDETAVTRLCAQRLQELAGQGVSLGISMGMGPLEATLRALQFVRVPKRADPRPFHLLYKDVLHPNRFPPFPSQWQISLADWDVL